MDPVIGVGPTGVQMPARRRGESAETTAARELEVVFLSKLMEAMRRTIPDSGLTEASANRKTYEGAFDRAVAETLARTDPLGLVQQLGKPADSHDLKVLGQAAETAGGQPLPRIKPAAGRPER
ncbi:MAG TPA: rod-binding protein [Candidatus Binatia bacterium]|jgi:Rod binding domain-containing protein|nr:rod-binding protein [Candidatus Binatia bacterium]